MVIDHVYADVGDDNIASRAGIINSPGPDAPSKNINDHRLRVHAWTWTVDRSEIAGGAQNIHAERSTSKAPIRASASRRTATAVLT